MTIINVTPNQDFSSASGLFHVGGLADMYHSVISDSFIGMARDIIVHLPPEQISDSTTNSSPQGQQYNSFFGRAVIPNPTTKNAGRKYINRDVVYKAQIRVGPREGDNLTGMGKLRSNEAEITVVIEALQHIKQARSISVEGRLYAVADQPPRPFGLIDRKYLLIRLNEIQAGDIKDGVNNNG